MCICFDSKLSFPRPTNENEPKRTKKDNDESSRGEPIVCR